MQADRSRFIASSAALGVTTLAMAPVCTAKEKPEAEEVSATEDLMREHGVLNRILLIYEEGVRRLRANEEITPDMFHAPATLVRKFVEDYHEQLEEKFIFPEFQRAKKLTELVEVLRAQHEAGRKVTDVILRSAAA